METDARVATDTVVRLDHVTKRFDDVVAVDDFTLEIERGEFFSLLGPSGCGKTTSLRMIGGFEHPDAGRIWLAGNDVTAVPPYRRNVNTVFQSYALFPHLTVFDNVAYGLRRHGVGKRDIAIRVGEMLDLVSLGDYGARKPAQLSGGQQQRVALARALVNHPEVLLLDEPLGALDLKLRRQMQQELKRIQSEVGITFVYVTHDQEEAMTMSDRIAVMRAGKAEQIGGPKEVYEQPATAFVAGFLGASNLLGARVAAAGNGMGAVTLTTGETVRLPARALAGLGPRALVGVRPEKIRLGDERGAGDVNAHDVNTLSVTLRTATFVGVNYTYMVETASGETLQVYAQNLGTSAERQPAPGERVTISWHPEHTFAVRPSDEGGPDE